MPVFAKKVIGTIDLSDPKAAPNITMAEQSNFFDFVFDIETKIDEMIAAGKTNGFKIISVDGTKISRFFLDQESAQEYIDFLTSKFAEYDFAVESLEIVDA